MLYAKWRCLELFNSKVMAGRGGRGRTGFGVLHLDAHYDTLASVLGSVSVREAGAAHDHRMGSAAT